MPLSSDEMTVARSWVGPTVSDAVMNERYDRLGSITAAVEEQLRFALAVLLEQPSSLSLPSGLSVQTTQNITAAQQVLKSFIATGDLDGEDTGGVGFAQMVRTDVR